MRKKETEGGKEAKKEKHYRGIWGVNESLVETWSRERRMRRCSRKMCGEDGDGDQYHWVMIISL